jgi:hypothetical protein
MLRIHRKPCFGDSDIIKGMQKFLKHFFYIWKILQCVHSDFRTLLTHKRLIAEFLPLFFPHIKRHFYGSQYNWQQFVEIYLRQ